MALKIVHLCDVHSAKGEDIPAAFAHTLTLDGGTYAIDLCASCDQERFLPLAAFLDAFGLLTDGTVDPRAAVAENLRALVASQGAPTTAPAPPAPPKPSAPRQSAPERPQSAPKPTAEPDEPESADELAQGRRMMQHTRELLPVVRDMLREAPEGLAVSELCARLDAKVATMQNILGMLSQAGRAEFIGQAWWAPENVPAELRAQLEAQRAIVHARNAVPRICPVDGEAVTGTSQWDLHCVRTHGAQPAQMLGLRCPIDGESFSAPQVLGMHGRKEHDAVHTPQLFQFALEAGDPLGIVAELRRRYANA